MRLAVIVPTFSPAPYERPATNLIRFREAIGVQFIHMLAPYYQAPTFPGTHIFETKERNLMWQKEALINIAIRNVPPEYDAIAWIDGDLLFENPDWYETTCQMLADFPVVQMFETITYLGPDDEPIMVGYAAATRGDRLGFRVPGGAIACRREIVDALPLYDRGILGDNDNVFMHGCIGNFHRCTGKLTDDRWAIYVEKYTLTLHSLVKGRIGVVPGNVRHLWHGSHKNRGYLTKNVILTAHGYDPTTDVRVGGNGLLEWASDKPELHAAVRQYFASRNEDGVVQSA